MSLTFLHVAAGSVALLAGASALAATKGSPVHRGSGVAFVISMLLMGGSGALIAAMTGDDLSIVAGTLTVYLVATAWLTVRRPARGARLLDLTLMLYGFAVGSFGVAIGLYSLRFGNGAIAGNPAQVSVVFGCVALLAATLDLRGVVFGMPRGAHRLVRHLWRMCFALFIAAAAFFLGQTQVFPAPLRNTTLLAVPVVAVLVLMIFWMLRVLLARSYRLASAGPGP